MTPRNHSSSFPILMSSLALMILGLALSPLLKVKLLPDLSLPSVSVSYSYGGANAVVVDSEVTSLLEAAFSRLEGLVKLRSRTGDGNGAITLEMEKEADMDAVRFEVSTLTRQVYPQLPAGVSYPQIRVSRPDEQERVEQLMSLVLNGPGNRWEIGHMAETGIKPVLSLIDGVTEVKVSGYTPPGWELVYDAGKLKNLRLKPEELSRQIREYYQSEGLGMTKQTGEISPTVLSIPVLFTGYEENTPRWDEIIIRSGERLFSLTDLVDIRRAGSPASAYYRINGLNTITIGILAAKKANQLVVAAKIKEEMERLRQKLPAGYTLETVYDSTVFLRDELFKTGIRVGLSLLLLLVFVWLVSRSGRYLLVMLAGMAANILIAFIIYYLAGIEIHLYSLAGITISLGMIIDNTIVMADHIRTGKGLSVFRGILAATLTTMGALVAVFFLDDEQRLLLLDFAWVITINLGVSLLISLFFIPALLARLPLPRPNETRSYRSKRRLVNRYNRYGKSITLFVRFRTVIFVLAVLGFGFPVFLLPQHIDGESIPAKGYNHVFGSDTYNESIRPVADKILGGCLRLFIRKTPHQNLDGSARRTLLSVRGQMYEGTTLDQANDIALRLENMLAGYEEIEQFQANVYGSGSIAIQIYFKKGHEFTSFPESLKSEMESKVVEMGAGDWTITGVGRGFDNSLHEGVRNSRVTFYGYNLEALKGFAGKFKNYLLEIQRVEAKSIFINGRATYDDRVHTEHLVDLDKERLLRAGIPQGKMLAVLRELSQEQTRVIDLHREGIPETIVLKASHSKLPDYWQFYNQALEIDKERLARMSFYGSLKKERATDLINKEDMEYTMVVEFDFIGSYGQKEYIVGKVIKKMADELPIGFRLKQQTFSGGMWADKSEKDNRALIILLVMGIIYAICAVVFESLVQPLAVLVMIPLSFIGVFLTFYLSGTPFGQGGYASMLLLSGLTVNSALYIINDLNGFRKSSPTMEPLRQYIHAFRQKLVPIVLTIFSTVLGLFPFLYGGRKEVFWFPLAVGTIGGLLFSLLAVFVMLPLFMRGIHIKRAGSYGLNDEKAKAKNK